MLKDPPATIFSLCDCLEVTRQYFSIILLPHDAVYFLTYTSPFSNRNPPISRRYLPHASCWDGVLWIKHVTLVFLYT